MHKEELIQLHMLLVQIKKYFEENGMGNGFKKYHSLNISPVHIHRSKMEHKHAIFVLGTELAEIVSEDDGKISMRMQELADRVMA